MILPLFTIPHIVFYHPVTPWVLPYPHCTPNSSLSLDWPYPSQIFCTTKAPRPSTRDSICTCTSSVSSLSPSCTWPTWSRVLSWILWTNTRVRLWSISLTDSTICRSKHLIEPILTWSIHRWCTVEEAETSAIRQLLFASWNCGFWNWQHGVLWSRIWPVLRTEKWPRVPEHFNRSHSGNKVDIDISPDSIHLPQQEGDFHGQTSDRVQIRINALDSNELVRVAVRDHRGDETRDRPF